jgi:hypothetical protein
LAKKRNQHRPVPPQLPLRSPLPRPARWHARPAPTGNRIRLFIPGGRLQPQARSRVERAGAGQFARVAADEATQCDIFFITLKKSERLFSPTTRYNDYAISPQEFHWESQSLTRETSLKGQRYIHHVERGSRVLLFVREESKRGGVTLPFLCLGFATYVSHEGERPMAIRWRLHRAIPGGFYPELAVAV